MQYSSEIRRYNILIILQTTQLETFRKCLFNLGPVACDVIITRMLYSTVGWSEEFFFDRTEQGK